VEASAESWRAGEGEPLVVADTGSPLLLSQLRSDPGFWRYREWLRLPAGAAPLSLGEEITPLVSQFLFGLETVLKLDFRLPSGSYKDRGMAVLAAVAKHWGVDQAVIDSSGNAAVSLAAYGSAAGIKVTAFVPQSLSANKKSALNRLGAQVVLVEGDREAARVEAELAAETTFYGSHVWQPFMAEGVQTIAFEIFEQTAGNLPETVVVPCGNGLLVFGLAEGFRRLRKSGLVSEVPKIVAVQSETYASLLQEGSLGGFTVAEGIAVRRPPRLTQIRSVVEESGGTVLTVSDSEIEAALQVAWSAGLPIEPTSAAVLAAMNRERVEGLAVLTGSLKK
ncbi:MAG: pyridoxal-phosphate dependent enzyme, partial [Fimbriimonadaceae bacterium]